jgi:hypothetical protein
MQQKNQENPARGRKRLGLALRTPYSISLDPATVALVEQIIDSRPRLRRGTAIELALWHYAQAHGTASAEQIKEARARGWLPPRGRKS